MSGTLWDAAHPYYCNEGNFYSNDCFETYESWEEFFDAEGNMDPDLNLVFRWDWIKPDPNDYTYDDEDSMPDHDTLKVFFVSQRKAILRSVDVHVAESDEPAVRAWLTERAKTITAIWCPILVGDPS
jgi:hypothetical protein